VVCSLVRPVPVRHTQGRTADFQGLAISGRLAKELLGWSPVTSFEAGVRSYLHWLTESKAR
jgi:nucleoside-diphosphate-sugar epimerase